MGLGRNLVLSVVITHGRLITHVDYDSAPNLFSQEPRALGRVPANIDSAGRRRFDTDQGPSRLPFTVNRPALEFGTPRPRAAHAPYR